MSNLSSVDMAWYQMEDPTNLMMVTGVVLFKGPLDIDLFRRIIAERLVAPYAPFRSTVARSGMPGIPYRWERDPHFDLDYHVRHVALPEPGDQAVLEKMVSEMMSTALDLNRPPWQFHVMDNYNGGSAVLVRLHHCIADGIALIRVLLSLTGETAEASLEIPPVKKVKKKGALDRALKAVVDTVETTGKMAGAVLKEGQAALEDPAYLFEIGSSAARIAAKGTLATAKLLLMPPDPKTPLKGKLGLIKLASWSRPVSLADVKRIGRVTDSKVNDVLMAAMTGALRRYLEGHHYKVNRLNFRAAVPVNLRPLDGPIKLGNEFGLVFLSLPVGIADPLERLIEVKRRMDEIKDSPEAIVAFGILGMLGVTPTQLSDQIVNLFGTKATAVATNVPGPQRPIFLAGSEIDNLMFWVPQSGKLGLGISILSYAGKVTLGVSVDKGLIPDPQRILDGFYEEFDALMELVHQAEE